MIKRWTNTCVPYVVNLFIDLLLLDDFWDYCIVESTNVLTLDSGINVGVRLLIFEKFWRQKENQKWSQCIDLYKKVLKSWCEKS